MLRGASGLALVLRCALFRVGGGFLGLRIRHERKESEQEGNYGHAENAGNESRVDYRFLHYLVWLRVV